MTVTEYMAKHGLSRYRVYRGIRDGTIPATKVGRRWVITVSEWHPQVHKGQAQKEGRTPDEFQWDQWPIENLTMGHPVELGKRGRKDVALRCICDMPNKPPLANQYELVEPGTGDSGKDKEYRTLPDPTGIALSSVEFQLRTVDTHDLLAESHGGYQDGQSRCGYSNRELAQLWGMLTPGAAVRVQVTAFPKFYYLAEDGSVKANYALQNNGYFGGDEITSPIYTLAMSYTGEFLIDGEPIPPLVDPGPTAEEQAEREAHDALMARERAEHERINREGRERVARENAESEAKAAQERREHEAEQERRRIEAEAEAKARREEREAEEARAAAERAKLGIRTNGGVLAKLTDPPNDDSIYNALVNLWSGQYDPDVDAYKRRLKELRASYPTAVDEVLRRLG